MSNDTNPAPRTTQVFDKNGQPYDALLVPTEALDKAERALAEMITFRDKWAAQSALRQIQLQDMTDQFFKVSGELAELRGFLRTVTANRRQLDGEAAFLVTPECEAVLRAKLSNDKENK